MVHGIKALGVFIPLQQREIEYPQGLEVSRLYEVELPTHLKAQFPGLLARFFFLPGQQQQQIARLCTRPRRPGAQALFIKKFVHT